MENASQALFMAAGVFIAVMVISIGVYLFSSASNVSKNYDQTLSSTEIQKFNNQFNKFEKTPKYTDDDIWYDYNTISDVVTAVNLAYDINARDNYDSQASVDVILNLGLDGYWAIWPDSSVKKGYLYKISSFKNGQRLAINAVNETNKKSTSDLLLDYSNNELNNGNRVYEYGFSGVLNISEETGLVNQVIFTLSTNSSF